MRRNHPLLRLALVAVLVLLPAAALAQTTPAPGPGGPETLMDQPTADLDTALGAWAAVGCGVFVRATLVTAGTQVGTIVGAVACCGYMLFDGFFVEKN